MNGLSCAPKFVLESIESFESAHMPDPKRVLLTGAAGFIGMHTASRLLDLGHTVLGLDNLNDYYEVSLKEARLSRLFGHSSAENLRFEKQDIADKDAIAAHFAAFKPDTVIHLAAQAGVRYSLTNPWAYVQSNLVGFMSMLEAARHHKVAHMLYASSSSVYGDSRDVPFAEGQRTDAPISLYAATKKSNEVMAASYQHLYGIPLTGLRFFTVYGPWGRPDMSPALFMSAVLEGRPIKVFNHGQSRRDFTYVDDIVNAVVGLHEAPAPTSHTIFNIGNSAPVQLMDYIETIEKVAGVTAQKEMLPAQPGDVTETFADTSKLAAALGVTPTTSLEEGLRRYREWYRSYYGV